MQIVIEFPQEVWERYVNLTLDGEVLSYWGNLIANGTLLEKVLKDIEKDIKKNTTNGDMIKAMFPNIETRLDEHTGIMLARWVDGTTKTFKADWWNAPYKQESEE